MVKRLVLASLLATSAVSFAQTSPIVGTWLCETTLDNRGNTFVIERRETYNRGGEHLSVARSYTYPAGNPDNLLMDVTVTTVGDWQLAENILTTNIDSVDVNDAVAPESEQAQNLAEFLRTRGAQSVNVDIQDQKLVYTDSASGQSLTCEPASGL